MSRQEAAEDRPQQRVTGSGALWSAALGGLVAWAVRLLAAASLVGWACGRGWVGEAVLYAISGAALAVGGWALRSSWRLQRRAEPHQGIVSWRETGFVAGAGVLLNGLSLALIVAETAFIPFVDPCSPL